MEQLFRPFGRPTIVVYTIFFFANIYFPKIRTETSKTEQQQKYIIRSLISILQQLFYMRLLFVLFEKSVVCALCTAARITNCICLCVFICFAQFCWYVLFSVQCGAVLLFVCSTQLYTIYGCRTMRSMCVHNIFYIFTFSFYL